MFRQKSVLFLALTAIMAAAIACSTGTVKPVATPIPPTATATPVPVVLIEIDPVADPVGFFNALPADEASCAADTLGGRERVLAMLESNLGNERLTTSEAEALDNCLSDETVRAVFIGQISREAGTLSDDTIVCIGEQIGGMSAAGIFLEEPAADVVISSLKGIFCLNSEERAAVSESTSTYGFGDLGGIDSLECVVNGVGPTGLADLMGLASADAIDFAALGDLLPLMIECGAVDDSEFGDLGLTADQVGCVLGELGENGLTLLDPTATQPDLSDISSLLSSLSKCGIQLEDLLGGSELPVDLGALIDPAVLPTAVIELPSDLQAIELPFTEEQIICLTTAIGEDQIATLLAGGAPDLSLFAALTTCKVDIATLLGG